MPSSKSITLRVPTEVLVAFDEKVIAAGMNRTETIVNFMRSAAGMREPIALAAGSRVVAAPRCKHPKEHVRKYSSWAICGECGARVA